MTHFIDGPATNVSLCLTRSPLFLRVVKQATDWDALDQVSDEPDPKEQIWVYVRDGSGNNSVHIKFGGKDKAKSGWYKVARYRFYSVQPGELILRDRTRWQAWCGLENLKLKIQKVK
jgi:hypothetical protein